ncbi:putative Queuine tRNA-ribosyltransferase-like protein [Bisporella sp. PMI_857]|nr:putative Queuine tRNA-ribosyltransferase-like protein [Bisporella sp. PMI_857]
MRLQMASKLTFQVLNHAESNNVGARIGKLSILGRKELHTPNFLAVSSRGVVPHMTPDVIIASSDIGGVHMALEDFIERKTPPILDCPGRSPLHTFNALPSSLITLLAPRRTPAVTAPNGNTNTSISIFSSTGFQTLSSKSYSVFAQKLQPDICIPLSDITYGALPGAKRILKMADRTEEWLSHMLDGNTCTSVFAPILPIDFHSQSDYVNYIEEQADQISGLAMYDSNLLPDIPATTYLSQLPRLSLDEPASPHHILRQVALGMDIFTIPFVGFATDSGIALSFVFPRPPPNDNHIETGQNVLPLGIDMWNTDHVTSTIPIIPSCKCYSCISHHVAFIQHLLNAKEMLGWVLIQIHNHHIMSQFFKAIRESIARGTFEADVEDFSRVYESELPAKSGQGPRVRGYHFKSEANQAKKNAKAWKAGLGPNEEKLEDGLVPDGGTGELEEKEFAEKISK